MLVAVCHQCESRARPCAGLCPCLIDGRDIIAHAAAGYCPLKKFGGGIKPDGWFDDLAAVNNLPSPSTPQSPQPPEPIPRDQWPLAVRIVARFAAPEDAGVGDTIKRMLGVAGEVFTLLSESIGLPCGCTDRQGWLNAAYPYRKAD